MKLHNIYFGIFAILLSNSAWSAYLYAEQTYDNGASSSTIFNVEIVDVTGVQTIRTVGTEYDSPESFYSATFTSPSGFTYSVTPAAILGIVDVYVDTPYADLASGIPTGIVWYHYLLDSTVLAANCTTGECINEAPTQFSEFAIWTGTSYPSTLISINAGTLNISLTSVPLPPSIILFASAILSGFAVRKYNQAPQCDAAKLRA